MMVMLDDDDEEEEEDGEVSQPTGGAKSDELHH